MNAELKATWIAALRSGAYQQCRRLLYDGKGFCCLGVEFHACHGFRPPANFSAGADGEDTGCFVLPDDKNWTEILHDDGIGAKTRETLETMNDGGKSFTEIADWIDANIPGTAE